MIMNLVFSAQDSEYSKLPLIRHLEHEDVPREIIAIYWIAC